MKKNQTIASIFVALILTAVFSFVMVGVVAQTEEPPQPVIKLQGPPAPAPQPPVMVYPNVAQGKLESLLNAVRQIGCWEVLAEPDGEYTVIAIPDCGNPTIP